MDEDKAMAEITWINHASYLLSHGQTRLLTDPWLTGTAFDDGWAHIVPTADVDWSDVTHIWISHEHPDHFSPKDLAAIPEELRASITVLFQRSRDQKVLEWCANRGFAAVEIAQDETVRIGPNFEVKVHPWTDGDSYLVADVGDHRVLNLNDCVVRATDAAQIRRALGGRSVDVLLTQFSYANWAGNFDQPERRQASGAEKLDRIQAQVRAFRPSATIPFASFVWFCHEENCWMNDEIVHVRAAADQIRSAGALPVVLKPGETWSVGEAHDSEAAIGFYDRSFSGIAGRPLVSSATVSPEELKKCAANFLQRLRTDNGSVALSLLARLNRLPAPVLDVYDHPSAYRLSLGGLTETDSQPADIRLGSGALAFCFRHRFGGATLHVNGRFTVPEGGDATRFWRWMDIASANNHGVSVGRQYGRKVYSKVRSHLPS